jgi:hypothetical protein
VSKEKLKLGRFVRQRKALVLLLAAAAPMCLTLICTLIQYHRNRLAPQGAGHIPDVPGAAAYLKRLAADRASLATESLHESMMNVITNDQQFISASATPRPNLEMMLGATRAVQVIHTVERLPATRQEAACRELFAIAFTAHTNQLRRPSGSKRTAQWQSIVSTDMAVCLAMFAAADLGLSRTLADQFSALDHLQGELANLDTAGVRRTFALPDNRFQLNVLRLVAVRDPQLAKSALKLVDNELETNAVRTVSTEAQLGDRPPAIVPAGARRLVSTSKGAKNAQTKRYEFLDWQNYNPLKPGADKQKLAQQGLIATLRRIVFAPQPDGGKAGSAGQ